MSLVSRTALTLLAGLVAVPFTPVTHPGSSGTPEQQAAPTAYAATAKEAHLSPEALTYIRPGLNLKIASVTNVAPGQKPVIEFFITDNLGGPLDRAGFLTLGPVAVRTTVAVWDSATRRYTNLIVSSGVPSRDTNGTYTDLSTRGYEGTLQAAPCGVKTAGASRSAVTRRFVAATQARVEAELSPIPSLMEGGDG